MIEFTDIEIIYLVNFLHSASSGLMAPVLANHFVANGGNHVILGILVSSTYVSYKISRDFIILFELRKKHVVTVCLYSSFITYLVLVFFEGCWTIYFDRVVYALTNQVTWFCKEYIARTQPTHTHLRTFNLIDIINVAATAMGSIIGGYMYDSSGSFTPVSVAASLLTLLALYQLRKLEDDPVNTSNRTENIFELPQVWYERSTNLRNAHYRQKWDSILLIFVYTFVFTIYYSRFAFLLSSSYQAGTLIIGIDIAYQSVLKFIAHVLLPFLVNRVVKKRLFFNYCLVICAVSVALLFYAPSLLIYDIIVIPVIVTYCIINELIEEDITELQEEGLGETINSIRNLVSAIGPFCFGILWHFWGPVAFQIFFALPLMVCVYFIHQRNLQMQEESNSNEWDIEDEEIEHQEQEIRRD